MFIFGPILTTFELSIAFGGLSLKPNHHWEIQLVQICEPLCRFKSELLKHGFLIGGPWTSRDMHRRSWESQRYCKVFCVRLWLISILGVRRAKKVENHCMYQKFEILKPTSMVFYNSQYWKEFGYVKWFWKYFAVWITLLWFYQW